MNTLNKLYEALEKAIKEHDMEAVSVYSQAIQRLTF